MFERLCYFFYWVLCVSLVRQLFHVPIERFFGTAWMSYAKPELGVMLCVVVV